MRPTNPATTVAGILALALLFSLAAPVAAAPGSPAAGGNALTRNSWIVTLAPGADTADAEAIARAAGGRAGHVYAHAIHGFQFRGSARAAVALGRNPQVASVQPDSALELTETLPFGIERVRAYGLGGQVGAFQEGFRGDGARIAVLDTGIDLDHPDLVASIDGGLGLNCIDQGAAPNDGYGHGTHVAGTAAAPLDGVGVVGIAPEARLVAVKMFTDAGQSSEAMALCALDHLVALNTDGDSANDIDVANMSWGESRSWGSCAADALHGAICSAYAAGIILVGGAGNSATSANSFVPAAYPEVISVSALTDFDGDPGGTGACAFVADIGWIECDDSFAFFSNYGTSVDVIAPGVQVYSTWTGGGWQTSSGTSMAAPHVSGVAALMAAAAPGLSPATARDILVATGECPNGETSDSDGTVGCSGQGSWPDDPDATPEPMLHALRAAQRATEPIPPPDPEIPDAPALTGSAADGFVTLGWTEPDDGGSPITGYRVYRADSPGRNPVMIATTGPELGYVDETVAAGATYWYEVAAVNAVGMGLRSNRFEVSTPAPPSPPATPPDAPFLTANAADGSVALVWTTPPDGGSSISEYRVYRGEAPESGALLATVIGATDYTDDSVANGTTYWYSVVAVNDVGPGPASEEAEATPMATGGVPGAPLNLKAKAPGAFIGLSWTPPISDGGAALTAYRVYRGTSSGSWSFLAQVPASQTSYQDFAITSRTHYFYVVRAVNGTGEGDPSNEARIRSR